ncbi:MAG: flagellar hook protein FlgE [Wenzhouxiangellaceae bacterium]|nr:flagellar hook protein FlgE [Wenzhouxiangellaceae bacterium]
MPFQIALSGLNSANSDLNITANNIANVNTTGFKRSRGNFVELFATGLQSVSSQANGLGARLASIQQEFSQGSINFTESNLDMAVTGDGFFVLSDQGALSYSRAGAFQIDREGFIVNAANKRLQVFPPVGDSNENFNTGGLQDLQLTTADFAPRASGEVDISLNLPADAEPPVVTPFDPTDPSSFNQSTSLTVFDSLGRAHTATYFFIKTANDNEWDVTLQINGTDAGTQQLQFDTSGALTTPAAPGELTFNPVTIDAQAQDITLTTNFSNATQFGGAFAVSELFQNGFSSGRLTGIDISDSGIVFARFTNGQSNALGKVALATFANNQGLSNLGDTEFGETFDSGDARIGEPGTSSFGLIQSGALEASNVNLTAELVNMITAQRNFQANAQMISTADTIAQTIINI